MSQLFTEEQYSKLIQSAIIDLRPQSEFSHRHLKNAFNLQISELEVRLHELPESRVPISLVGEKYVTNTASDLLAKRGYEITFIIHFECFYKKFKPCIDWFSSGNVYNRLWQPSSVVQTFFKELRGSKLSRSKQNKQEQLKGLDLACGAGRDAIYMALNGWRMTAVDHLDSALQKAKSLALNNQCKIETVNLDLESKGSQQAISPFPASWDNKFDLVIVARYLHRPLLHFLNELINANGFIVYQTFLEGSEKFGSPKNPRFLLKQGELAEVFSNYNILYDEVEYLRDGRPTNAFIAQKQNQIDII